LKGIFHIGILCVIEPRRAQDDRFLIDIAHSGKFRYRHLMLAAREIIT
jgi:hypothetical protein